MKVEHRRQLGLRGPVARVHERASWHDARAGGTAHQTTWAFGRDGTVIEPQEHLRWTDDPVAPDGPENFIWETAARSEVDYQADGKPSHVRVFGARGQLLGRIDFDYDASARLVSVSRAGSYTQIGLGVHRRPPRVLVPLLLAVGRALLWSMSASGAVRHGDWRALRTIVRCGGSWARTKYRYDAAGHVVEQHDLEMGWLSHDTKYDYNERGDLAGRRESERGREWFHEQYAYDYDAHDNWTRKRIVRILDQPGAPATAGVNEAVVTREIEYFA